MVEPPSDATPPVASAALVLTPLSHAVTTHAVHCAPSNDEDCPATAAGVGVDASAAPAVANVALVLARPSVNLATRAFGATARRYWNTTRTRGDALEGLAYWSDNQAGYSWWSVGPDQTVWGVPEDIYATLKQGYDAAGLRIRAWEPDNNFVVRFDDPKNWNGVDLTKFNETL